MPHGVTSPSSMPLRVPSAAGVPARAGGGPEHGLESAHTGGNLKGIGIPVYGRSWNTCAGCRNRAGVMESWKGWNPRVRYRNRRYRNLLEVLEYTCGVRCYPGVWLPGSPGPLYGCVVLTVCIVLYRCPYMGGYALQEPCLVAQKCDKKDIIKNLFLHFFYTFFITFFVLCLTLFSSHIILTEKKG